MISKEEAEAIIEKHLDISRLRRIIRNTSIVAWGGVISDKEIDNWLTNFTGKYFQSVENERKLALWMLSHFSYYTMQDIRVLCKNLFNGYLHEKLSGSTELDLGHKISDILSNTIFVGLGNDSESGNNILYYFRQENQLSKQNFEIKTGQTYENLVYMDDVTVSGQQATEYIQSRNIKANHTYAALLIATEEAVKKLKESDDHIIPIATMILDQRDRAFSESSYVFSEERIKEIRLAAQEFCKVYGEIAVADSGYMVNCPLGFSPGQYMISFEYNTPDNTLPIFWGTGSGWIPLFKRYSKVYHRKEYVLDGRKYY